MDVLLKEMQEMDRNYTSKPIMGPSIVEQVRSGENKDAFWPGPPKNDESMAEVRNSLLIHELPLLYLTFILVLEAIVKSRNKFFKI